MKIAIVGAGGVGGFLGGLLARAGHDVSVLARGSHLAAIRTSGLQVRSSQVGDITVRVRATDDPAELGRNDLVVVAVKMYDFPAAARATAAAITPEGLAVTVQNGLDAPYDLAKVIGREHVLTGTAGIEATVLEPGVIGHLVALHVLTLCEFEGPPTPRLAALADTLKGAGINVSVGDSGFHALWNKAALLIPFATATTAANCGVGALVATPEAYSLTTQLFDEVTAVALATGYDVSSSLQRSRAQLEGLARQAPRFTSSMNRDVDNGKPIELEWLTGKVIQL
ncbi:MAG: 2-dehydropantoate 2-reductase, partial [Chloroflexi bacterium]|nr:2-dehydropantoate 2-reductase [Chloroflexota bacterium]